MRRISFCGNDFAIQLGVQRLQHPSIWWHRHAAPNGADKLTRQRHVTHFKHIAGIFNCKRSPKR